MVLLRSIRFISISQNNLTTQGHLSAGQTGGFLAALQKLASASVTEVAVTELDIVNAASNDYLAISNACLQVPKCVGITVCPNIALRLDGAHFG